MLHPVRWLLTGITLLVLAAVGFGAWYVFGGSAPAKPQLSACTARPHPTALAGKWTVDPAAKGYVGYRMTEVFTGDVVHKTAVGRTPAVSGSLTFAGSTVTAVDVVAQMQQLTSDRSPRDNYIHTHAIESDTFPTSGFKLTAPVALPSSTMCTTLHVAAKGMLKLHGVTRPITIPLEAHWDGRAIQVIGSVPIVLADYKITPPETSVVKADDHGALELSLTFVKP